MTERYYKSVGFSSCKRRQVVADFSGGDITSNGGVMLLRELDRRLKLTESVNRCIADPRRKGECEHAQLALLKQRIHALALGYEDLNDHTSLRLEGAVQTAVDSDKPLAAETVAAWHTHLRSAIAIFSPGDIDVTNSVVAREPNLIGICLGSYDGNVYYYRAGTSESSHGYNILPEHKFRRVSAIVGRSFP